MPSSVQLRLANGYLVYALAAYYAPLWSLLKLELRNKLSRVGGGGWVAGSSGNKANSAFNWAES